MEREYNISLFDLEETKEKKNNIDLNSNEPLAQRLKPSNLDEFVGQDHILAKDKLLYRSIKGDRITSLIFYGPPGVGKTSLAKIIAKTTKCNYVELNAVTSGIKDIKNVIDEATREISMSGKKTILFIDEIHRFNKTQQDSLLPHVEKGIVTLVGATTENPFFEVNKALLSRSMIFKLELLSKENIVSLLNRALKDRKLGYGSINIKLYKEAEEFICDNAVGDGRRALNALELAVLTTNKREDGIIHITLDVVEECMQKKQVTYDKSGDYHYDIISAFIKSIRGSDPDASVHYLARMLSGGEDPEFIARRLVISASEDIGNADPYALLIANAALNAVKFIGMPEARIPLAQATIYLAGAPKSNASYNAINLALEDIEKEEVGRVPLHLRGNNYSGSNILNEGSRYKYPHDYENHYVRQQYMPKELLKKKYYTPTSMGYEKRIKDRLDTLKK
ncbi:MULTISPECIES: replication-associated recombination protein A [unclassified Clostridium]|uniref:replication-associated recombination protein A n=1 Tax=unclassified Clostridium TaxID=2614128 RepID=UPI000E94BEBF|nr:replication-associated recombination protein RarA [Clostridium sp.]